VQRADYEVMERPLPVIKSSTIHVAQKLESQNSVFKTASILAQYLELRKI
jgi:hypothetical protein